VTRVVCLGNELLADDGVGPAVARRLRGRLPPAVQVVETPESGFALLDHLLDADVVVVVDAVTTGTAPPGTIHVVEDQTVRTVYGGSPHYVGLFEGLAIGRALGLPIPRQVTIVAVEVADSRTVGGPMHPAVAAAADRVAELIRGIYGTARQHPTPGVTRSGAGG
jgi:hydrogenase maturation protease